MSSAINGQKLLILVKAAVMAAFIDSILTGLSEAQ